MANTLNREMSLNTTIEVRCPQSAPPSFSVANHHQDRDEEQYRHACIGQSGELEADLQGVRKSV